MTDLTFKDIKTRIVTALDHWRIGSNIPPSVFAIYMHPNVWYVILSEEDWQNYSIGNTKRFMGLSVELDPRLDQDGIELRIVRKA